MRSERDQFQRRSWWSPWQRLCQSDTRAGCQQTSKECSDTRSRMGYRREDTSRGGEVRQMKEAVENISSCSRTLLLGVDVVMTAGRSTGNVIVQRRGFGAGVRAMGALRGIHKHRWKGMDRKIETGRRRPICDASRIWAAQGSLG